MVELYDGRTLLLGQVVAESIAIGERNVGDVTSERDLRDVHLFAKDWIFDNVLPHLRGIVVEALDAELEGRIGDEQTGDGDGAGGLA